MTASLPSRAALSPRAPLRRPRLHVTALAAVYALGYLAWLAVGGADERLRGLVSELVFLPVNLAIAVVFLRAAARDDNQPGMRRALRLLAAASAALVGGNLVTVYAVGRYGRVAPGSLADVCFLANYPLTLAAYLSIPVGARRMERWKLVCDAGMVLSGAGVALWYFVLRPLAVAAVPAALAPALVYPLGDLLLLVGIVTIALRHPLDDHRGAIGWIAASTALSIVADLAFNLVVATTGARSLLVTDALYFATYLPLLVAAELFLRQPAAHPAHGDDRRRARLGSLLPFAAAGAVYALLCVVALGQWVEPLSGLAIGAVAVSVFLGARQLLAFREKAARAAQDAVRASEARFRSLVQHSSDLVFLLSADGIIRFASSSATRLLGRQPETLVGMPLGAIAHPADAAIVDAFVRAAARLADMSPPTEWRLQDVDGSAVQVEAVASNRVADDAVRGIVVNARDVRERKALLDQLAHQAFHDPLTGLANRALFYDRVTHALDLGRRQGHPIALLYLDLDGFKEINDTLGHAAGDRLLTMVAARLRACARATDTVARLGGDEFALLVDDAAAVQNAARLVERIREQMAYPFPIGDREVRVSASIGSAAAPGGDADEVLRRADLAMYAAKRSEKGSHRAYEPAMR